LRSLDMDGLGQFFILGYQAETPSSDFLRLVRKYDLGGFIFFTRNITSPSQLAEVIRQLKSYFKSKPILAIDQEGGRINRITQDFPLFPANRIYAENKDKKGVKDAYRTTAQELFKLGINLNLVPVSDILGKGESFMGDRSFSDNVDTVAEFTSLAIKAVKQAKVLTCAKHFPGIGSLVKDPHEVLPQLPLAKKEFEQREFIPFKVAIKSGVDCIMTTHVVAPALDSKPVTFSKKVVTDILQKKLKFKGLVLSDDMEMKAIADNFDFREACVNTFLAGHDQILICHSLDRQVQVLEHFEKQIRDKKIPSSLVKKKLEKILKFKKAKLKD